MLILREEAPDPVLAAAFALAEAAALSEDDYTPDELAAQARGAAVALAEAGGLFSWIKRHYLAHDPAAEGELRREIEGGVRDEAHRKELIDHCDKLLGEVKHSWRIGSEIATGGAAHLAANVALGAAGAPILPIGPLHLLVGIVGRTGARTSGAVARYVQAIKRVRSEIEKAPVRGEGRPA